MMATLRKRPSRAMLLFIFALILIAGFLPDLVAKGWHLLHGNSVQYRDWDIPVPAGWFVIRQGEGLTVERMLRFALWQHPPTMVFLPMYITSKYVFDRDVWKQEQIRIQARYGYQFVDSRDIRMSGQPGYCWEFARVRDTSRLWITCIAPAERLSADFTGKRADATAFYSILSGLARTPRQI